MKLYVLLLEALAALLLLEALLLLKALLLVEALRLLEAPFLEDNLSKRLKLLNRVPWDLIDSIKFSKSEYR